MTPAEIVSFAVSGVQAILSLAQALGQRDAVIAALDAVLAAARSQTDRDLDRKHRARADEPTVEVVLPKVPTWP